MSSKILDYVDYTRSEFHSIRLREVYPETDLQSKPDYGPGGNLPYMYYDVVIYKEKEEWKIVMVVFILDYADFVQIFISGKSYDTSVDASFEAVDRGLSIIDDLPIKFDESTPSNIQSFLQERANEYLLQDNNTIK